jgi:hypothetical protein
VGNVLQEAPLGSEELLYPVRHLIKRSANIADAVVAPPADSRRQVAYSKTPYDFRQLV